MLSDVIHNSAGSLSRAYHGSGSSCKNLELVVLVSMVSQSTVYQKPYTESNGNVAFDLE